MTAQASGDIFATAPPPVAPVAPPKAAIAPPSASGDLFATPAPAAPPPVPPTAGAKPISLDAFAHTPGANPMDSPNQESDIFQRALVGRSRSNPGKLAFGAMNTAGMYMDVPLAAAEAAAADAMAGNTKHLKQVWYDLTHAPHSGGGAANVAQNDVYFRQHSLHRVIADPSASYEQKAAAQYFLDHPWVAGAADFATEFANPSNLIGGLIGRGVGLLGKIPMIDLAVSEGMNASGIGTRTAGLRAAELTQHMPDTSLTGLGQVAQDLPKHAQEIGGTAIREGFEGLPSREDMLEAVHRQQGNKVKAYADPALEAGVEQRGNHTANVLWTLDANSLKRGTIDLNKTYGHAEEFPGVFDPLPRSEDIETSGAVKNPYVPEDPISLPDRQRIVDLARGAVSPTDAPGVILDIGKTPEGAREVEKRVALMESYFDHATAPAGHSDPYAFVAQRPEGAKVTYFPMAGALTEDVGKTAEQREFTSTQGGGSPSTLAIRKGTAGANAPRRSNPTLVDYQNQNLVDFETGKPVESPLRSDWEPPAALLHHVTRRTMNNMSSDWAQKLLSTGIAKGAKTREPGYAAVEDTLQRQFGGEAFKDKALPQTVITYLNNLGASRTEAQAFVHYSSIVGKLSQELSKFGGEITNLLRQGVVFNPIVHGFWNIGFQYLAAGGRIDRLAVAYQRAFKDIIRYAKSRSEDFESVIPKGSTGAEQSSAVLHMGNPREYATEQGVGQAMLPWNSLKPGQKLNRVYQRSQQANRTTVFDIMERHVAIEFYNQKLAQFAKRMPMDQAVNETRDFVRRTLGNYGNVSSTGFDKTMNGVFFFYPWLKTVLPFWIKNGLYKPQSWNAPLAGIQTSNELRGDPNARTSGENPYAMFLGNTPTGNPSYFDMMFPQRIGEQFLNVAQGVLGRDPEQLKKGIESLLFNRLNPPAKAGAQLFTDTMGGKDQPFGLTGYAPPAAQAEHMWQGMSGYIPSPLQGLANVAAAIHSGDRSMLPQAFGQLIGGYGFTGLSNGQRVRANKIAAQFHRRIDQELAIGNKDQAWKFYQMLQALYLPPKAKDAPVTNPQESGVAVPKL